MVSSLVRSIAVGQRAHLIFVATPTQSAAKTTPTVRRRYARYAPVLALVVFMC